MKEIEAMRNQIDDLIEKDKTLSTNTIEELECIKYNLYLLMYKVQNV